MARTILITGATSGIGKAAAEKLAETGFDLILVCRNKTKMEQLIGELLRDNSEISVKGYVADFASFQSIRKCAAELNSELSGIDVLINNAGTFNLRFKKTEDGFEHTFAVNYLAPFLFTNLILPLLSKRDDARIINVGSDSHYFARLDLEDLSFQQKKYSGFKAYSASRMATVFFTQELADRLEDKSITVNCVHPGHVATNIWNFDDDPTPIQKMVAKIQNSTAITPEEGAQTVVYCSVSNDVKDISGSYFANMKEKKPSRKCRDHHLQRELWKMSSIMTKLEEA